jgi:hypothetical protein
MSAVPISAAETINPYILIPDFDRNLTEFQDAGRRYP